MIEVMPKKKKSRSKKSVSKSQKEQATTFWPLAGAILMFVLAFFLLLGGFGAGGNLPVGLFRGVYWAFGWASYLTPMVLVYFGALKFVNEDKEIPLDRFVSMSAFLLLTSASFHTIFVRINEAGNTGGHGGYIGEILGNATLLALNKVPTSILFVVLAVLAFFFSFRISLKVLLKLAEPLKSSKKADKDLKSLQEEHKFKLNEGVPTAHSEARTSLRTSSSLKNSAKSLSLTDNHEALTAENDPDWKFPSVDLLNQKQDTADPGNIDANAEIIKDTLANFNINVEMDGANVGPKVTQYTLKPPTGVKLTKIVQLENNLQADLAATSIRIEAPIPGMRLVGIEVPNKKAATVNISSVLSSEPWQASKSRLNFVIGKDIGGKPIVSDLASMPHLLVAGQTGSGKSVMINDILVSLLYRNSPSDLKLILIDPKEVELTPYNDIPHLLTPVINEPEKCISALKWAVAEMQRRLKTMSAHGKRNIADYNQLDEVESMPYIVIVIDELSDLMMMAARDVEALVVRLAQKARATGIHLVLATQRPSVDVITGLIKANVPGRIAFTTQSQVDSRTIIDQMGAEKLLGEGDMLLKTARLPKPKRIQAAFISDSETKKVIKFLKDQRPPQYDDEVISQPVQLNGKGGVVVGQAQDANDDLWRDAVSVVIDARKASTSLIQRRLNVGYARAARLIDSMEEQGIVGPSSGSKPRDVLVDNIDEVFGRDEPGSDGDVYDEIPDDEA